MSDYDNTNRGGIWKNDKKETEKHPDFRGDINVEGVEYWVSGWKRKPDANPKSPALQLSLTKKEAKPAQATQPPAQSQGSDDFYDEDIPY